MFGRFAKACTGDKAETRGYKRVPSNVEDSAAMYRLKEAVQAVNVMLPTPITLEMAVLSADGVKKLVKGQSLARMYAACMKNLECLSKHVSGSGNPGLDAVVETHKENSRRLADACVAAILHMYMSIGTADGTDAFVEHAIQLTAAMEISMNDLSLAEKALGLRPTKRQTEATAMPSPPTAQRGVLAANEADAFDTTDIEACKGPLANKAVATANKPSQSSLEDESGKLPLACAWSPEPSTECLKDPLESVINWDHSPWSANRPAHRLSELREPEIASGACHREPCCSQSASHGDQIEVLYDGAGPNSPLRNGAKNKKLKAGKNKKAMRETSILA